MVTRLHTPVTPSADFNQSASRQLWDSADRPRRGTRSLLFV